MVNSPSVSRRTTSWTPTFRPFRVFREVVRLSEFENDAVLISYQDDSKTELVILSFIRLIFGVFRVYLDFISYYCKRVLYFVIPNSFLFV